MKCLLSTEWLKPRTLWIMSHLKQIWRYFLRDSFTNSFDSHVRDVNEFWGVAADLNYDSRRFRSNLSDWNEFLLSIWMWNFKFDVECIRCVCMCNVHCLFIHSFIRTHESREQHLWWDCPFRHAFTVQVKFFFLSLAVMQQCSSVVYGLCVFHLRCMQCMNWNRFYIKTIYGKKSSIALPPLFPFFACYAFSNEKWLLQWALPSIHCLIHDFGFMFCGSATFICLPEVNQTRWVQMVL